MPGPSIQALAHPEPIEAGIAMGEVLTDLSLAPVLKVSNLRKRFATASADVLRNVSFDIPPGQSVALVGANGCGKSTLLRCCLGLLPVTSGSVSLLGEDLGPARSRQMRKIRSRAGLVFQKHNLVPQLTVLSNVLHGAIARNRGARAWFQSLSTTEDRMMAMECLDQVGLADLAARRAGSLSGGQSQRVAIARALMQQPDILFADEPAASLDPNAGQAVMDLFRRLQAERNITLLFVSHNVEHALDYADRLIGLKAGEVLLDQSTGQTSARSLDMLYV